jgi:hypothetical protein
VSSWASVWILVPGSASLAVSKARKVAPCTSVPATGLRKSDYHSRRWTVSATMSVTLENVSISKNPPLMASRLVLFYPAHSKANVTHATFYQVTLNSGITTNVYGYQSFQHQRSFLILPGMQLVGLTGEIGSVRLQFLLLGLKIINTRHRMEPLRASASSKLPTHHVHPCQPPHSTRPINSCVGTIEA